MCRDSDVKDSALMQGPKIIESLQTAAYILTIEAE